AVRAEQQRLKEKALQKAAFINELIRYIDPCKQAEDEIESLNEQQKATTKSDSSIAIARAPDTEASYVGGYVVMQRFIASEVRYPQAAIDQNLSGRVDVSAVVDATGKLLNIKVLN